MTTAMIRVLGKERMRSPRKVPLYYAEDGGTTIDGRGRFTNRRGLVVANDLATKRDKYLRPAQAAAILHVSPQTVRRWAVEGKLPYALTAGGHRRFPRHEVQRLGEQLHLEALDAVAQTERL